MRLCPFRLFSIKLLSNKPFKLILTHLYLVCHSYDFTYRPPHSHSLYLYLFSSIIINQLWAWLFLVRFRCFFDARPTVVIKLYSWRSKSNAKKIQNKRIHEKVKRHEKNMNEFLLFLLLLVGMKFMTIKNVKIIAHE